MSNPVFLALAEAARAGEPVALGIIARAKGSSPQKNGAKAVFYADGRIQGTLGGGCLEAEIQQRAIQALRHGEPATFDLLLDHDFGWDDGLICGGKVQGVILPNAQKAGEQFWSALAERKARIEWGVGADFAIMGGSEPTGQSGANALDKFVRSKAAGDQGPSPTRASARTEEEKWLYMETVSPPCELWIAGAGHIAQAVAPLAAQLDFQVTVFDDRPALVNHQIFPREISLKTDSWENLLSVPFPDGPSFGLIVTRGHRHDALVLKDWVQKPFLFLGMIGSARKARTIFEHFLQEGLASPEQLRRVSCPVGIEIRSRSVMEIAVSIMAQFIEKRAEAAVLW